MKSAPSSSRLSAVVQRERLIEQAYRGEDVQELAYSGISKDNTGQLYSPLDGSYVRVKADLWQEVEAYRAQRPGLFQADDFADE